MKIMTVTNSAHTHRNIRLEKRAKRIKPSQENRYVSRKFSTKSCEMEEAEIRWPFLRIWTSAEKDVAKTANQAFPWVTESFTYFIILSLAPASLLNRTLGSIIFLKVPQYCLLGKSVVNLLADWGIEENTDYVLKLYCILFFPQLKKIILQGAEI